LKSAMAMNSVVPETAMAKVSSGHIVAIPVVSHFMFSICQLFSPVYVSESFVCSMLNFIVYGSTAFALAGTVGTLLARGC